MIMLFWSIETYAIQKEDENFCNQVSEYAHTVMDLRQKGVLLSKQLELSTKMTESSKLSEHVTNAILSLNRQIIYKAYEEKLHKTQLMKNKATEDFRRFNLEACLANIR